MNRRDIPPEDRYGGGQSYRPGNVRNRTPPPRRDRDVDFRGRRSPPRRPFEPRGGRSRSPNRPPFRYNRSPSPRERFGVPRGGDSYRTRPRSPIRRDEDPRDNLPGRGGRPFYQDDRERVSRNSGPDTVRGGTSRSPHRSPRFRNQTSRSPARRDARRYEDHTISRPHSPPRRRLSPRGSDRDFQSRPRSPVAPGRARSPSPRPFRVNRDLDNRDRGSAATSRRSSPQVHASRLALVQDIDEPLARQPLARQPVRSPEPRRNDGSPRKDKDGDYVLTDDATAQPVPVNNKPREPPLGPSAGRAPPAGPGGAATRTFAPPPSGPRGDGSATRGGFALRGRGGFNPEFAGRSSISATFRGGRGGAPSFARVSSYNEREHSEATSRSYPTTSRAPVGRATSIVQRFDTPDAMHDAPRESRNAALSTVEHRRTAGPPVVPSGPALDRQKTVTNDVHPALRGLPEPVPNGKKLAPVVDRSRMEKLEEETERLRKLVQEKEPKKRKNFREWDRLVRESETAEYRSTLANDSLRSFESEIEVAGVAF
ncbi:hypothetical protein AMS68_007010 [Peltaster fructicola]|uniref:Uncharacterized protein n=1 Tax=Peltaster fructicola TaxID=286661 RepID=A0A6H0Y3B0_9PEZI|nr:hypothetical protein AMS68_007010 [Peltaster fructicola]